MRSSWRCDGCAIRRVRCNGGKPCQECQKRSLACTFLRVQRKRGPKGPRVSTSEKIKQMQEDLYSAMLTSASADENSPGNSSPETIPPQHAEITHEDYIKYLDIFKERLYSVWPVVDCDELIHKLLIHEEDYESYALAASLCAATIAQMRLPEHDAQEIDGGVTSSQFIEEVHRLRQLFEYREIVSIPSLLTSFFLHIFYANAEKIRSAGSLLREAIGCAFGLRMHESESYLPTFPHENQLKIRIFWILFISERTYCIQNDTPMMLQPIEYLPEVPNDETQDRKLLSAFVSLTQLFVNLDGEFARSLYGRSGKGCGSCLGYHRDEMSTAQRDLCTEKDDSDLRESQQVDIAVTRQWIRTLLWQYTVSHFPVSCNSEDPAFSSLLPAQIAKETLSTFNKFSPGAIKVHGYGMELKLFRLGDALLDVLVCVPPSSSGHTMLLGARDALHALEHLILMVGGGLSPFLQGLRDRMAKSNIPVPWARWLTLEPPEVEDDSNSTDSIGGYASLRFPILA
ncbi:hypothetical protein TWF225_005171 [Orbilia oligospora]|uniref:Uncharacterized protein n=1 Tax=Orbilia oligospora TaxID=2813651 RepID=A0A7C8JFF0_ORBOL|nr:hypothetical protein TWF103_000664 [Orbilia oligospora]KAF3105461.1 hypothetical protein TWF102_002374 [Orbilia oligospora]KAF3155103.1 hypothetical protein TWF751_003327 [Orbilia oligospora]KAF3185381.1 hypothetical protein TWF225_005171 [Orbilia oligospora]KAF3258167.1 hypothetical protein TWF217_005859 [Orbilia oligospora]